MLSLDVFLFFFVRCSVHNNNIFKQNGRTLKSALALIIFLVKHINENVDIWFSVHCALVE